MAVGRGELQAKIMMAVLIGSAYLGLAALAALAAPPASAAASEAAAPISGIELQYADDSVRLQDDFYRHVNGKWLASTQIPPDMSSYDSWHQLDDDARAQLHGIVVGLLGAADPADPDQQKIADLYASFMDEEALERLALTPLDPRIRSHRGTAQQAAGRGADGALQPDRRAGSLFTVRAPGCQGFDPVRVRSEPGWPGDAGPRLLPAE